MRQFGEKGTSPPPSNVTVLEEGYAYDASGNRTAVLDAQGDTLNVMRYNRLNLPEEYASASGDTVRYVYSADGEKLYVLQTTAANDTTGTEYAVNYRIENGSVTMIHTDAGYYTPSMSYSPGGGGQSWQHMWYLKDHLGNNRVLADGGGNPLVLHDYDPYGEEVNAPTSGLLLPLLPGMTDSPYKYGGKEWTATTSTYDFEARQLAPTFHRFTTMDPLCEKYYSISPYAYCANNPVNLVDPRGKDIYRLDKKTGEFILMERNDDSYDQVGSYKKERDGTYTLRTTRKGKKKILIDEIEKGILVDGLNLKENNTIFEIDNEQGPSVIGIERFLTELGDVANVEIGGMFYSAKEDGLITDITVGAYKNNRSHQTNSLGYTALPKKYKEEFSVSNIKALFHTHPNDLTFTQDQRQNPSNQDIKFRDNNLKSYPWVRFFILTQPPYGSNRYSYEYTY